MISPRDVTVGIARYLSVLRPAGRQTLVGRVFMVFDLLRGCALTRCRALAAEPLKIRGIDQPSDSGLEKTQLPLMHPKADDLGRNPYQASGFRPSWPSRDIAVVHFCYSLFAVYRFRLTVGWGQCARDTNPK